MSGPNTAGARPKSLFGIKKADKCFERKPKVAWEYHTP